MDDDAGCDRDSGMVKTPHDLRKANDTAQGRKATLPLNLHLEKAKVIATEDLQRMDALFAAFADETSGYL